MPCPRVGGASQWHHLRGVCWGQMLEGVVLMEGACQQVPMEAFEGPNYLYLVQPVPQPVNPQPC